MLVSPDFSALAMEERNMDMNHSREYWYMGSMLARPVVQKNSSWVRVATGMYLLLVLSISLSVCSASDTFAWGGGGREEGKEGEKEEKREKGREGGRKEGRKGGMEGGKEGERKGGKGGREGGREGRRKRGRKGEKEIRDKKKGSFRFESNAYQVAVAVSLLSLHLSNCPVPKHEPGQQCMLRVLGIPTPRLLPRYAPDLQLPTRSLAAGLVHTRIS